MRKFSVLALALAAIASPVAAQQTAVNLITPGAEYSGSPFTLGFEFTVSSPVSITALGVYDSGADGLTAPASIGLYDTSGNLLTSGNIAAGGGTLDGLFRYVTITPFSLTPGTDYVIGSYESDNASSLGTDQGGTGTINPLVTIIQDRYNENGSLAYPDLSDGHSGGAWLGANFQFSISGVPEPATWAMMLIGFGAIGFALRRRRTRVLAQLA